MKRIKKLFKKYFDTKSFFLVLRFIILLFLVVAVLNFTGLTLSKYKSDVEANISPDFAFFITDVGAYQKNFELGELLPSATAYSYTFVVSNYEDDRRTNVNLEYTIEFTTTTNLPLNYKIFKSTDATTGNGIVSRDTVSSDSDGMYLRLLEIDETFTFTFEANESEQFIIWVEFPENYKYYSEQYEGVVELVEVKINSKQIV